MVFGNFINFKIYDNIQSITIQQQQQQQQQALIEDIRLILSPSLQKTGFFAAFKKRGYSTQKRGYRV